MKIISVLFPVLSVAVMLYAYSEAKHSAYGVTPRFYLSSIPYIAFIMIVELFMVTDNNSRMEFLDKLFNVVNHGGVQTILLDVFLICGIKYFLTGNNTNKKR